MENVAYLSQNYSFWAQVTFVWTKVTPVSHSATKIWLKRTWCFPLKVDRRKVTDFTPFKINFRMVDFSMAIWFEWTLKCMTRKRALQSTQKHFHCCFVLFRVVWNTTKIINENSLESWPFSTRWIFFVKFVSLTFYSNTFYQVLWRISRRIFWENNQV